MDFYEIINSVNQDCKLSKNIKHNNFTEKIKDDNQFNIEKVKKENIRWYQSLEDCIIETFDPMIKIIPNNEKYFYMKQLIIKICSDMDELNKEKYEDYGYIKRIMNKQKIQSGLQGKNMLSSLLYLSDYYKIRFVIIKDKKYYNTCIKSKYQEKYLLLDNNKFQIKDKIDKSEYSKGNYFENSFIIENNLNISSFNIYKTDMKAISNYSLKELCEIAKENNIQTQIGSKNKKKIDLYNEIIFHKISSI